MRAAIMGSHGVGKTTLLDNIEHNNKIQEIAREVMDEMGKIPQDMTPEELLIFQTAIYKRQLQTENNLGDFISDRAIVDNLAYAREVSEGLFQVLLSYAKQEHTPYDRLFYIPIEFGLEKDGTRFEGMEFQKKIDDSIKEIAQMLGYEYITITGSVEERKKQILDHMR